MSWRDIDEAVVDRVLAVDIKGTMYMIHEHGTRMLGVGGGNIVTIASTVVVRGSSRAPQYAAGKYGIIGLTKSYAAAFAPTVRVNAFGPGFMSTESTLTRSDWLNGRPGRVISQTPMGRVPNPEELAGTVLWLATDDASHTTGNFIMCDGGYSMIGALPRHWPTSRVARSSASARGAAPTSRGRARPFRTDTGGGARSLGGPSRLVGAGGPGRGAA